MSRFIAVGFGIWLVVANLFAVVGLDIRGNRVDTTVIGTAIRLWFEEMRVIATLVVTTAVVMPVVEIVAIVWLFVLLRFGKQPSAFAPIFRALLTVQPWAMVFS